MRSLPAPLIRAPASDGKAANDSRDREFREARGVEGSKIGIHCKRKVQKGLRSKYKTPNSGIEAICR